MSNIDELMLKHCPTGVAYVLLSDVADTVSGLSGKSKSDFADGNARYVSYKNIFANLAVNQIAPDFVKVGPNERQHRLHLGDVLFTGSSETAEEVGMSSVVVVEPDEPLYLNSFCFALRFRDLNLVEPGFTKYLFRSGTVRAQIQKAASGVTRINISKPRFLKVRIPVPPIEVQREIVKVLDTFSKLEAELEAEERERRIRWAKMSEFSTLVRGNGMPKVDFAESGVGAIHYGQIYTYYGTWTTYTKSFVPAEKAAKLAKVDPGDIVITNTSENIEDVGKAVAWLGSEQVVTGGHATVIKHDQNPKYLAYYFQTAQFGVAKRKRATGTKVIDVSATKFGEIEIPLPSLEEQERIVAILDSFNELVNDLSTGLPAELNARRKQYEHYRDRLLTFQEAT